MPARIDRTNEIKQDKHGVLMKIIKYVNHDNIYVQFLDDHGAIVHTNYDCFTRDSIKNPFYPSVYGVGYLGQGEYVAVINKKMTKPYSYWKAMMQRCYCKTMTKRTLAYEDVVVCDEWHNFQNFAKWFDKNYYEVENKKMCLDKDIIGKHKNIYSPETCVFIPQEINGLFALRKSSHTDLPIGVYYDKTRNKYTSQCNNKHFGYTDDPHEAFLVYKTTKENKIKELAQEYNSKIPKYIFDILLDYEVDEYY